MARNRIIKPQFWTDEVTGTLSDKAKLFFIGMLNFADDEGKIVGNTHYLNSIVFPYCPCDIDTANAAISELKEKALIFEYSVQRQTYFWIVNFRKHQKIDKPQQSQIQNPKISDKNFRKLLFDKADGICPVCNREMVFQSDGLRVSPYSDHNFDFTAKSDYPDSRVMSIDHIISKNDGGSDAPHNLRAICCACNKSKGTKSDFDVADNSDTNRRTVDEYSGTNEKENEKENENGNENEKEKPQPFLSPQKQLAVAHLKNYCRDDRIFLSELDKLPLSNDVGDLVSIVAREGPQMVGKLIGWEAAEKALKWLKQDDFMRQYATVWWLFDVKNGGKKARINLREYSAKKIGSGNGKTLGINASLGDGQPFPEGRTFG